MDQRPQDVVREVREEPVLFSKAVSVLRCVLSGGITSPLFGRIGGAAFGHAIQFEARLVEWQVSCAALGTIRGWLDGPSVAVPLVMGDTAGHSVGAGYLMRRRSPAASQIAGIAVGCVAALVVAVADVFLTGR